MRLAALLAVLSVAAVLSGPGPAARQQNLRIEPGKAIGQVRVGMTFAQVRAVLGKPNVVNRRERFGFSGQYVEYDWGWGKWTVGFSGRGSTLRVALVATSLSRERTREGVGPGSAEPAVRTKLREAGVRCDPWICWLGTRYRSETAFLFKHECLVVAYTCPSDKSRRVVSEVRIRTAAVPRSVP